MLTTVAVCAGLIPDIIDAFPDVKIAGSKVALMYLKGLTNRDFTQNPVKGGDKIDLGKGTKAKACTCLPCYFGVMQPLHQLQIALLPVARISKMVDARHPSGP